ncbi:MAG: hypothetical protein L0229_09825 [Blastocatellia bacterium]|nr:hypothetical protein [Blastocatellia bacterium]
MNTREENIAQAIDGLGIMYRALDSLREDVLPVNPRLFAVMAEGPLDQMRNLLDQIDILIGTDATEEIRMSEEHEEALDRR